MRQFRNWKKILRSHARTQYQKNGTEKYAEVRRNSKNNGFIFTFFEVFERKDFKNRVDAENFLIQWLDEGAE